MWVRQLLNADDINTFGPESPGKASANGSDSAPVEPPYFLLVVVKTLKQLSEFGQSASAIVRLGTLQPAMRLLGIVPDFREEVVLQTLELLWNVLEHSASVLGTFNIVLFALLGFALP